MTPTTLDEYVARLKAGDAAPLPDGEEWAEMVERTAAPGRVHEVTLDVRDDFLEVLPPRWMGAGFAFGEGADPLRLFWKAGRRCFCRQLSDDESEAFCRLAGISPTNG